MRSNEFIIWLKGFTEACNEYHPTPKQWDRIKEVLNEVQDYNDNPGLDVEIDDWYHKPGTNLFPGAITFTSGSSNTSITNLPNGANITYTTKQQLND